MINDLILCIPGPWKDQHDFLRRVIAHEPAGRFMFAGKILADLGDKEPVVAEFTAASPEMGRAFELAGQGRIAAPVLDLVQGHESTVYLHFSLDLRAERERLIKFTRLLQELGGHAVKVESAGCAHTWERWFALLNGSPFDLYCAAVVLIGGQGHYYSCGMHHFGLPDCAVPGTLMPADAADLMNRFNHWQITEAPALESGHTFSLAADEPTWRLTLEEDDRHAAEDLFFNPHGLWTLSPA